MKYSYKDGKIYKLYNKDKPEEVYIGSTTNVLNKRYSQHKYIASYSCSSKILFEDNNTPIIELLENYPCNNKKELELRERYWIEKYPKHINNYIPARSKEEYDEINKEILKQYRKEYYIKNREEKKEYQRQYYIKNK